MNAEVQVEITRQRAILMEQSAVAPESIVAELAVIAFSDLGDYIRVHPDGTASIELGDMPPGATRAIASLNTDTTSTSVGRRVTKLRFKLHDKYAALVTLAKTLGMLQEGGVNLTIEAHDSAKLAVLSIEDIRKVLDSGAFDADQETKQAEIREIPASSGLPEARTGAEPEA